MPGQLPSFLGLGTQKGGTTTLHQLLTGHPQVFLPPCKEVHYFDLNAEQPSSWYAQHFSGADPDQRCGEITPFYLFHPKAPQRIKALLPQARLVVLLRDPVERTLSQVFHARKRGFEPLSPDEALAREEARLAEGTAFSFQKHSYLSRSRYLEQLDRYETLFEPEQLLVLRSESLFENPAPVWQELQRFLRLRQMPLPGRLPNANRGDQLAESVDPLLRSRLREALRATAEGVRDRYGFGWDWA